MDLDKSFKANEVDTSYSSNSSSRLQDQYIEQYIDCRFAMSRMATHPDERPVLPAVDEKMLAHLHQPAADAVLFRAWNHLTTTQRTQVQHEEALYCNEVAAAIKRSSQGEQGQLLVPDLPVGPGMRALTRQMEIVSRETIAAPK